jgi:hypothetical protein
LAIAFESGEGLGFLDGNGWSGLLGERATGKEY